MTAIDDGKVRLAELSTFQPSHAVALTEPYPWGLGYSREAIERVKADLGSLCSRELALAPDDLASVRSAGPGIPLRKLLAQRLAADPEVKKAKQSGGQPGNRNAAKGNEPDNVRPVSQYGNSAAAIVRRLKRDAPEVAAALAAGEYPSARAAGIAAGIVRVPTRYEAALKAVAKLSKAERRKLGKALLAAAK